MTQTKRWADDLFTSGRVLRSICCKFNPCRKATFEVNSFTVSDQGEPHTQEHLLITKGNKGRNINASEAMTLSGSTASTSQAQTIYQFNAAGGSEVFYNLFNEYLAYSNVVVVVGPDNGRFSYYAERTPELPQILRFVIEEVKRPLQDASLSEYVIAQTFYSRASSPYQQRGEAIASNLADNITPDAFKRFRQAILDLRKMPNLAEELYKRKYKVYERVLPGYGKTKGKDVTGANYFVIGAEKQMSAYETYLKSAEGADTKLYRLYPRDYRMPMK